MAGPSAGSAPPKQFETYAVSSATALTKRHDVIRSFQKEEKKAKVMVIAMRIGNCGITLTAATRVYLMEPCVDPATELQAAGRIHRLGQSKDVFVKRFAFKESYEERVVQLHEKIRAGSAVAVVNGRISAATIQMLSNDYFVVVKKEKSAQPSATKKTPEKQRAPKRAPQIGAAAGGTLQAKQRSSADDTWALLRGPGGASGAERFDSDDDSDDACCVQ